MRTTCIIGNYKQGSFVVEAVTNALNQTIKFDEIIVVDDCSPDDSPQIIKEHFADDDRVTLIFKEQNEGQLAVFNTAFLASSGDIIFFLDADDSYQLNYLEEALKVYQTNTDCDFIFCLAERIGKLAPPNVKFRKINSAVYDCGYSAASTFYLQRWVGDATSTLSMRRSILSNVLPLPYTEDWRIRADDCLVYGASIAGARKFFLNKPLVNYRFHGNNSILVNDYDGSNYLYKRILSMDRLFSLIYQRMGYQMDLAELAVTEFKTIQSPNFEDLNIYIKIIRLSKMSWSRKLKQMAEITGYFYSFKPTLEPQVTLETQPKIVVS